MTTTKSYFKYHFCGSWKRLLIFTVLGLLLVALTCNDALIEVSSRFDYTVSKPSVDIFAVFLGLICIVTPVIELSAFNNKKNNDTIFVLPISRKNLLSVHLINGLFQIIISYTFVFLGWLFFYVHKNAAMLNISYIPLMYIVLLAMGTVTYIFYASVFSLANTTSDGIVFMFLWSLFPFLISWFIYDLMYGMNQYIFASRGFMIFVPFGYLYSLIEMFEDGLAVRIWYDTKSEEMITEPRTLDVSQDIIIGAIFYAVLLALSLVCIYYFFRHKKLEQVGEISESYLGYRLLGPTFTILAWCVLVRGLDSAFCSVLYIIVVIAGYTLYWRGFHFKNQDWAIIILSVILSFLG